MARGPSAEHINRHGTPTGMQNGGGRRQQSRDNGYGNNIPYATGGSMGQRPMGNYGQGGPKIATTNTRLQRF